MIKRFFDLFASLSLLILIWPLLLLLAVLVRINLGSPILFSQARPGRYEHVFNMHKFRSMTDAKDEHGELQSDDKRLTRFGKFLRNSSLDELPGLLSVIKGDISLVGPRPLLVEYLPLYTTQQARRHEVRPGITGWAQVNGRNALSWEQKFEFDVWYVENQSLWLDIKILFMTVFKVLKRSDISHVGEATMSKFEGSKASEKPID
ncbi:sugar transferase [uncultured Paraglaciecola sp.]|uniref:sugar transferase n=1 Tax=uncultured Paraglaciecola sp. TaxID=1765024 RepID=UPI0025F4BB44|nr:sugar transferase [uncultured Paraglaciecola sp.]